jgi:hypothetical protein
MINQSFQLMGLFATKPTTNQLFRFSKALDLLYWRHLKGAGYVLRHVA